jgi:hypothetical protein
MSRMLWCNVVAGVVLAALTFWYCTSLWLSPRERRITYPEDILVPTSAPIYQATFKLQDAIFSSKFESGNLKSAM